MSAGRYDRMGVWRSDGISDTERYGSLYLVKKRHNGVNDYGGSIDDVEKLTVLTAAAPGSTCLFTDGTLYRKELDGWAELGTGEVLTVPDGGGNSGQSGDIQLS